MDNKWKTLFAFAVFTGLLLGCYYSTIFKWIFIGILFLSGVFIFLFIRILLDDHDEYPERKWGKDWQKLVAEGKLGEMVPYKCTPNDYYANKAMIEKKLPFKLPDFKVTYCEESLGHFTGDFIGMMNIEFVEEIPLELLVKPIRGLNIPLQELPYISTFNLSDDPRNQWILELTAGSREAKIKYGYC